MNKLSKIFTSFILICALTLPINASSGVNDLVLQHVNQERTRLGQQKLQIDQQLSNAAAKRSQEIVQKFSHTRPNSKEWHSIYDEYNIFPLYIGENVAKKSYNSPPSDEQLALDFYNLWKNSAGHYQNMIKSEYDMIGLAIHKEGNVCYMTQLFNSKSKKQDAKPSVSQNTIKDETKAEPQAETKDRDKNSQSGMIEKLDLAAKEEAKRKEIEKKEKEIKAKEEEIKVQEELQNKKEDELRKKEEALLQSQKQTEKQKRFMIGLAFIMGVIAIVSFIPFKS